MKTKTKDRASQGRNKVKDHQTTLKAEPALKVAKVSTHARTITTRKGVKADKPISLAEAADLDVNALIQTIRVGVPFPAFQDWSETMPFTPAEWATYLHLSERTLQRYKKEAVTFDALQSEKILEILLLVKKGTEVFEDKENFVAWLEASNVALGYVKPKHLLDSSFGINLLREELTRIEHGVLA